MAARAVGGGGSRAAGRVAVQARRGRFVAFGVRGKPAGHGLEPFTVGGVGGGRRSFPLRMGARGGSGGVAVLCVAVEAAGQALVALRVGCSVVRVGAVAFAVAVVARSFGVVPLCMRGQTTGL